MLRPVIIWFTLCIAAGWVVSCSPPLSIQAVRWWGHVEYLASDDLRGRDTGSEGYRKAAEYVASEFKRAGAVPGNGESFFQHVDFVSRKIREPECRLALMRDGNEIPIELGAEAALSVGFQAAESVHAPVVFVGYGLRVPEIGHDDFEGLDLRGKVVIYIREAPAGLEGPLRAHTQDWEERWKVLRETGAIGAVHVSNPKHTDVPWERATLRRLAPSMELADPALGESEGLKVSVRVNPDHAEKWFEGSGHTFAELLALSEERKPLPRFPLPSSVVATVRYEQQPVQCMNVIGIIPGSDPVLKDEYVVLTGHLDHLGVGGAVEGDSIYNGAMDNASGIATLIEIAREIKASGTKPKRSLMLIALTGEEKGLLGSRFFAAQPTVPLERIIANVNMDMYMPLAPFRHLTVYGLNESDLGKLIGEVASAMEIMVQDDPEPERNIFVRSDQYNFIKMGVPALSFKFGFEPGSAEEQLHKEWIRYRYHAPSDDLRQPVDKEAAVAFTRMLLEFSREIANRPDRPGWKDESFFKRFARPAGV